MKHRTLALTAAIASGIAATLAIGDAASSPTNSPAQPRANDAAATASPLPLQATVTLTSASSDPVIDDVVFAHLTPHNCDTACSDDDFFVAVRSLSRSATHTEVARRYIVGLSEEELVRTCSPEHPLSTIATYVLEIEHGHPAPDACRSIVGRPIVAQIQVIDRMRHIGHIDDQTAFALATELASENTDTRVLGVGYHALLLADDRTHLINLAIQRLEHIDTAESQEGSRLASALATCAECRSSIASYAPDHPIVARLTPRFIN